MYPHLENNMDDLSPRQIELLKAIILEYTEIGDAVGSDILDKKYKLGVSPATIRNDMVVLAKNGYLKKEYFSSGRVPTAKAFRFYIKNLMHEKELSTAEEVSYKSDVWDFRHEVHKLLQHSAKALAKRTQMLAVAITDQGDVYYFGVNNILATREFWDITRARYLFEQFDQIRYWGDIIRKLEKTDDDLLFIFADDEDPQADNIASVFADINCDAFRGALGVVGPRRMRYDMVVPNIRYFANLIETIVKEHSPAAQLHE
jgi:heat-inducible transcriptional repressor